MGTFLQWFEQPCVLGYTEWSPLSAMSSMEVSHVNFLKMHNAARSKWIKRWDQRRDFRKYVCSTSFIFLLKGKCSPFIKCFLSLCWWLLHYRFYIHPFTYIFTGGSDHLPGCPLLIVRVHCVRVRTNFFTTRELWDLVAPVYSGWQRLFLCGRVTVCVLCLCIVVACDGPVIGLKSVSTYRVGFLIGVAQ